MQFIAKLLRFWVILVFMVLTGYVAIYNNTEVALNLPPLQQPIILKTYEAFMAAFLLGATVVLFFFGVDHIKKSLEIRRLNRRIRDLAPAPTHTADQVNSTPSGAVQSEPSV